MVCTASRNFAWYSVCLSGDLRYARGNALQLAGFRTMCNSSLSRSLIPLVFSLSLSFYFFLCALGVALALSLSFSLFLSILLCLSELHWTEWRAQTHVYVFASLPFCRSIYLPPPARALSLALFLRAHTHTHIAVHSHHQTYQGDMAAFANALVALFAGPSKPAHGCMLVAALFTAAMLQPCVSMAPCCNAILCERKINKNNNR